MLHLSTQTYHPSTPTFTPTTSDLHFHPHIPPTHTTRHSAPTTCALHFPPDLPHSFLLALCGSVLCCLPCIVGLQCSFQLILVFVAPCFCSVCTTVLTWCSVVPLLCEPGVDGMCVTRCMMVAGRWSAWNTCWQKEETSTFRMLRAGMSRWSGGLLLQKLYPSEDGIQLPEIIYRVFCTCAGVSLQPPSNSSWGMY